MKTVIAIFIVFIIAACSNAAVEKPEKLIEEEQMVNIIYDLAILEAVRSRTPSQTVNPNTYILKKYKVDSLQFVQNNRYYASDIENYKKLYEKVEERIKTEKSTADSLLLKNGTPVQKATPEISAPQVQ